MKMAIVGCGTIVENFHLNAIKGQPGLEIAYVIDLDKERAAALSQRAKLNAKVISSVSEAREAEIFFLATPPRVRFKVIKEIPSSARVVVVEKPVAFTESEVRDMRDWAEANDVEIYVAQTRRLFPNVIAISKYLRSHCQTFSGTIDIFEGGLFGWESATNHLSAVSEEDGGILHDVGAHLVDVAECFLSSIGLSVAEAEVQDVTSDNKMNPHHVSLTAQIGNMKLNITMSRLEQLANVVRVTGKDFQLTTRSLFSEHAKLIKSDQELMLQAGYGGPQSLDIAFQEMWRSIIAESQGEKPHFFSLKIETVVEQTKFLELANRIIRS